MRERRARESRLLGGRGVVEEVGDDWVEDEKAGGGLCGASC